MTPGFLLTRQWTDTADGVRLDFWLATAAGPKAVSIHAQQPLFFIRQADATAAAAALDEIGGADIRPLAVYVI